ncbi:MAG: flavoprotein [Propionicimonas sp.]
MITETEVRALVREALAELLAPPPRRALVLFTGGLLGFDDAVDNLRMLAAEGVQLDYLQTPSATRILDQRKIAALGMREVSTKMVEEHDMLIAPTLTSNIAAKVAHGVADCLASNLFSEFIMSNRLVVVSRTAICPDGAPKQSWFPQMPPAYADLLRANLTALASFGVRLASAHALARTALAAWDRRDKAHRTELAAALGISPVGLARRTGAPCGAAEQVPAAPVEPGPGEVVRCERTLISQQVIQQLPDGVELRIPARASVTAMARDIASTRSIRISREV